MVEYGQPLHAFDYDLIKGDEIIVRQAKDGEGIVTLDEKKRSLTSDDLIIADKERPIAIAGVMGGLNTEVTQDTDTNFIRSSSFLIISVCVEQLIS